MLTTYSNRPDLATDLRVCLERLHSGQHDTRPVVSASVRSDHVPRTNWRVKDRLTADDISTLCAAYQVGASVQELAERYEISWSSVKTLLRERGVKRPRGTDRRSKR